MQHVACLDITAAEWKVGEDFGEEGQFKALRRVALDGLVTNTLSVAVRRVSQIAVSFEHRTSGCPGLGHDCCHRRHFLNWKVQRSGGGQFSTVTLIVS